MIRKPDLAALIGSRICHDLISPLSAIGNGVELLAMTAPAGPEMSLIAESVENANARIRFFRVAYGAPAPDQMLARSEVMATLGAASRGGRLGYRWQVEGDQPRDEVRIVFLLLQCCETAMARGGEITIRRNGQNWDLSATADRIDADPDLWGSLLVPRSGPEVSPAQVQFALLPQALESAGRHLALKLDADRIEARF